VALGKLADLDSDGGACASIPPPAPVWHLSWDFLVRFPCVLLARVSVSAPRLCWVTLWS
jgi:hypothetical protein